MNAPNEATPQTPHSNLLPLSNTDREANMLALLQELDWLDAVIQHAVASYLKHDGHEQHWLGIPPPAQHPERSAYGALIHHWQLTQFERIALALALAPSVKPEILDIFFGINANTQRGFSEFGGVTDKAFSGFLPTEQTLVFILSGNNPEWRADILQLLSPQHRFGLEQVLQYTAVSQDLPLLSRMIRLSPSWMNYLLSGEHARPELSSAFPAHRLQTPLTWDDLVLDYRVMQQIDEIRAWLTHGNTLMHDWGLANKVKPGYRAVFFGPPGTGKTLTAALLGQSTGRDVYRVDLSMIVSKYIGETEKNLSRVFDAASYREWILFFDEADALFGKRTAAHSSNDRHANQQTGYLLQRIEDFPGTVILATNLKANMDEAFTRRFQSMVQFTIPEAEQRFLLWQNAFNDVCDLDSDVDLQHIAETYPLAGGAIINVLRQCALQAIRRGERRVSQQDLLDNIRREFRKDNKTL